MRCVWLTEGSSVSRIARVSRRDFFFSLRVVVCEDVILQMINSVVIVII